MFKPAALAALVFLTAAAAVAEAQKTPIQITADLTEAPRKLYHAEIDLPVKSGPAAFETPKWIPGNHRPTGPVDDITGVVFTANGQVIPWRRDDVNLYQFHVTVPKGVTTLHVHLDCIVLARATTKMAVLEWEKLLLYPSGIPVSEIPVQASITVQAGWGIGTALTPTGNVPTPATTGVAEELHTPGPGATTMKYAPTTVEQLQDSPVIAGQYFKEFALASDVTPKHFIDIVADAPEDVQLRPALLAELNNLVHETGAMYASRHYNEYHFLLTLSDIAGGEGLEHGQSSDNGVGEKGFSDADHQLGEADLLAHEFTHSWNGKYRRPAKLYQKDFYEPEQGDLLWVYEGMTQYLGNVLAARSGLKSQDQYRDLLALSAANLEYKSGRQWRSTEDTAVAASILRGGNPAWSNWKRGQDYYQEGELLWLDADTLIRKLTGDKKSLNDFEHIFLGKGGNTGPLIVTYTFDEIVKDLNEVTPYDWRTFLHDRIMNVDPKVDLAGIEQGGYKLVYTDKPSKSQRTLLKVSSRRAAGNYWYSLGFNVSGEGVISDVRWGSPADKAKLAPGTKIVGVNGSVYSGEGLKDAVDKSKEATGPIHFITQNDTFLNTIDVDYHDGPKFPRLVRVDGTTDYLDEITKPLTTPETAPEKKDDNN